MRVKEDVRVETDSRRMCEWAGTYLYWVPAATFGGLGEPKGLVRRIRLGAGGVSRYRNLTPCSVTVCEGVVSLLSKIRSPVVTSRGLHVILISILSSLSILSWAPLTRQTSSSRSCD